MAHFYLIEDLSTTGVGEMVHLGGAEGHHAAAVSRIREGQRIQLGDGNGLLAWATVVSAAKNSLDLTIDDVTIVERRPHRFTLVQALAKTDRDERAVEATTELGIDAVIPWQSDRSVSRWDEAKAVKGQAKWQTIAREACKQCIRPYVPIVHELVTSSTVMDALDDALVLVLEPTAAQSISDIDLSTSRHIAFVVGPEGGISEKELAEFEQSGAILVSAGRNILRTSTAGTAALSVTMSRLGYL